MATMGGVSQPLMTQDTPPYPNTPPYPHTPQYPAMPPPQYQPMVAMTPVVAAPPAPTQNNVTQQTVVVNQPGDGEMGGRKERLFVDPEGVRGWSTGLCACLNDLGSCLCSVFFIPCMMCRVSNRLKECAFVTCTVPCGLVPLRVKLRTIGGIKGDICRDCVAVTLCTCCVVCQMSRELDSMGL